MKYHCTQEQVKRIVHNKKKIKKTISYMTINKIKYALNKDKQKE